MDKESLKKHLTLNHPHSSSVYVGFIMIVSDFIAILFSIALGFFIVNLFVTENIHFKTFINYSMFIPFFLLVFGASGLYPAIMMPPTEQIKKIFFCSLFGFSGICLSIIFFNYKKIQAAKDFFITYSTNTALCCAFILAIPIATFCIPVLREFIKMIYFRKSSRAVPSVVYCKNKDSQTLLDHLIEAKTIGYAPAIIISEDNSFGDTYKGIPVFTSDCEILPVIKAHNIKVAILFDYEINDISFFFTKYRYVLTFDKKQLAISNTMQIKDMSGILGFSTTNMLSFKTNLFIKRITELFLVILFSPIWFVVFCILFIAVKVTSPGPALYAHKRVGKNGSVLKCLKFRSMCKDADKQLEKILAENPEMRKQWEKERKFQNDPRVTPFGKFLRKTSLDELPQLLNVLRGNMSLIGPRPVTESELEYYGEYADYVFSVKPGLSGMWQVSGRSDTSYEERITFDTYYIQNWSIWLDVWILIKTVSVVLSHKGAY